jgi:hypothetical protein
MLDLINSVKEILDKYKIKLDKMIILDEQYIFQTFLVMCYINKNNISLGLSFYVGVSPEISSQITLDFSKINKLNNIKVLNSHYMDSKTRDIIYGCDAKLLYWNKIKNKIVNEYEFEMRQEECMCSRYGFNC